MTGKDGDPNNLDIKITDFGFSTFFDLYKGRKDMCGSPLYMAPEILLGHPSCETCDWWSIGCFATELLCGTTPFAHPDHSVQRLVRKIIHEAIELPHHEHIGALYQQSGVGAPSPWRMNPHGPSPPTPAPWPAPTQPAPQLSYYYDASGEQPKRMHPRHPQP